MLSTLLNGIIRFALHNRMLVAAVSVFLLLYGGWQMMQLPIDVFPNLNRPRVVIMTQQKIDRVVTQAADTIEEHDPLGQI